MSLRPRMQQKVKWHANCMANHYPMLAGPRRRPPNSRVAARKEHRKVNFQGAFDGTGLSSVFPYHHFFLLQHHHRFTLQTVGSPSGGPLGEANGAGHSVSQPVSPCCVAPTGIITSRVTVCRYRTGLMLLIPSPQQRESR